MKRNVVSVYKLLFRSLTRFDPPTDCHSLLGLEKCALIGMGFSANDRNDLLRIPGTSNREIAKIIAELYDEARKRKVETTILAQREIAEALYQDYPEIPIDVLLGEIGTEKHISSHDILGQAWKACSQICVRDAIVIAHKAHALRSCWNAEMWGFEIHFSHRYAESWAPESKQIHTRNALFYSIWELFARFKLIFIDRPK